MMHPIYWMALNQAAEEWAEAYRPTPFEDYLKQVANSENDCAPEDGRK